MSALLAELVAHMEVDDAGMPTWEPSTFDLSGRLTSALPGLDQLSA